MTTRNLLLAVVAAFSLNAPIAHADSSGVTKTSSGPVDLVKTARGSLLTAVKSAGLSDLPGAMINIQVPAGRKALLLARFTAESSCYVPGSSTGDAWCTVAIVAKKTGGAEMTFAPAGDFAFDSSNDGRETASSWEGHAMDRSIILGPGAYDVRVKVGLGYNPSGTAEFDVDDWHLAVERSLVPGS